MGAHLPHRRQGSSLTFVALHRSTSHCASPLPSRPCVSSLSTSRPEALSGIRIGHLQGLLPIHFAHIHCRPSPHACHCAGNISHPSPAIPLFSPNINLPSRARPIYISPNIQLQPPTSVSLRHRPPHLDPSYRPPPRSAPCIYCRPASLWSLAEPSRYSNASYSVHTHSSS